MIYFEQVMGDSLESRVAVNSDNIEDLKREVARQRDSIHKLAAIVHSVRVLTKAVEELQESMPILARRAAKEAVAEARRARHSDLFANLRTYAALLSGGAAIGGLVVVLVLR